MSKPKIDRDLNLPVELIEELLTSSELRMVKQRLYIINLLAEGLPIRVVAERAEVGTDTVVRIARKVEQSPTLRRLLGRYVNSASSSHWVIGSRD